MRTTGPCTMGILMMILVLTTGIKCSSDNNGEGGSNSLQEYIFSIDETYKHDSSAFTQGLVIENGELYESTGLYGQSGIRKVDLKTGDVLFQHEISDTVFGEGLTHFDGKLIQLTWKSGEVNVFSEKKSSFSRDKDSEFKISGEGWGLTNDGKYLIMSDGSDAIYFLDPKTQKVDHSISVRMDGVPLFKLNELEYIDDKIYANVWQQNYIVIINPDTGLVSGRINVDLDDFFSGTDRTSVDSTNNVLNGIAWDADKKKLYITGKKWPKIFEVSLVEKASE
jgi:glutaminyl-peptide cyclotransferase